MKYQVTESQRIEVSQDDLAPLINNLENWPKWSPWLCLEPSAQVSFSEDHARMSWKGDVIGEGSLEIDSVGENFFLVNLTFKKPFKSKAQARFDWYPNRDGVDVSWTMFGNLPWFLFFLKPLMTGWVRMDYKRGLNRLKSLAENGDISARLSYQSEPSFQKGFTFIGISRKGVSTGEMERVMGRDFGQIHQRLPKPENGDYITFYDKSNIAKGTFDVAMGATYDSDAPAKPQGPEWSVRKVPEHKVVRVELKGTYEFLGDAWSMAMMTSRAEGKKYDKKVSPYESYQEGPHTGQAPVNYITKINVPVSQKSLR